MVKHLTVRLAWHDNKWDGTVCEDPESNVYCVGSHSLLSARIAKNRDLDIEKKNKGKRIDKLGKYLPPCYWSTNAFSKQALTVWHKHPFPEFEKKHVIPDKLSGYSVFTWPFHVGYVLDNKKKERSGKYPMDLDDRIDQFQNFFSKGKSLVFLYLNYDNPISAEDSKYALVGCATLNKITPGKDYSFTKAELKTLRSQGSGKKSLKNFPTLNWAMTVSYDFDSGVLLPYHEYLEHKKNSGDSESLDEMKILIDEEDLQQNFKYVAMDMDDDACIYLLTRLRNSFEKIKGHGIISATSAKAEIKKIDKLLERSWKARGTYPSLGNVLDVIANMGKGKPGIGNEIVSIVEKNNQGKVNLDVIVKLLNKKNIPKYLDNDKFRATINEISVNIKGENLKLLQKLSLFSLSQTQIKNIIRNNEKSFRKSIDVNEIVENPYLLCENYKGPDYINRDELEIPDKKIGTFTIDIGMFPDPNYLGRNKDVQNLDVSHPYRLRAVISDHLKSLKNDGDCYAVLDDILKMLKDYPLFYRPEDELLIDKNKLASVKYINYFKERLEVIDKKFFYLTEIKKAEDFIKTTIQKLLERDDHKTTVDDLDKFLIGEADTLSKTIKGFEKKQFINERTKLIEGCIKKSFFVITGKPGSGKTKALKKVVDEIKKAKEKFVVLAPTGKASLRLQNAIEDPNAQTIDKFIYSKGYNKILENFESFSPTEPSKDVYEVKNLIIDESSMLDLKKVAVLFKMLYGKSTNTAYTNRVIFVGDENQLPPIGYGKPFFDIIKYLKEKKYADKNFVRLETNCRQRFDDKILKIADLFRGEKTCYEELISGISSGKFSSTGFHVELWDDETELYQKIDARLGEAVKDLGVKIPKEKFSQMNLLFGLNENGSVQGNFKDTMKLDRWQLITPYRAEYFGTLGLNAHIKSKYRENIYSGENYFVHSDKIICIENQYEDDWNNKKVYGKGKTRKEYPTRTLTLSNGSMGMVNIQQSNPSYFFPDLPKERTRLPNINEAYEHAYGITIHKSQGSEFEHTFVVLPRKSSLLSRELVYTALSRSTNKVTLFLQKTSEKENILEYARDESAISRRKTSIFDPPVEAHAIESSKRVPVRSKIEFILYEALKQKGIDVEYEEGWPLEALNYEGSFVMHPDFTIKIGSKKLIIEHLGMIDPQYWQDWTQVKRPTYEKNGIFDKVITTVDNNKVPDLEKIDELINDLINDTIKETPGSEFSNHHYELN